MGAAVSSRIKVGDRVRVPWGVAGSLLGQVVEVWGDPARHIRVALELADDLEQPILLLTESVVEAA